MEVSELVIGGFTKDCLDRVAILDADGNDTHILYDPKFDVFDEPTFTCSDADRSVFFIVKD